MKIGVFDSGVGGLTVAKPILKSGLFEKIYYFGDTARVPYGSKDKATIIQYSLEAVLFFKQFDIDLLVVACNSVSAVALKEMKKIAPFKIIGVIEAGVLALKNSNAYFKDSILVLGTQTTIDSGIYQTLLKKLGFKNIMGMATGLFVPIVEEGIFQGELLHSTLEFYFSNLEFQPKYIILGCTHFPLISQEIYKYFKEEPKMIHSGEAIVELLKLEYAKSQKQNTTIEFFSSENPNKIKNIANKWNL